MCEIGPDTLSTLRGAQRERVLALAFIAGMIVDVTRMELASSPLLPFSDWLAVLARVEGGYQPGAALRLLGCRAQGNRLPSAC